jgi:hypothetical protein
MEIGPQYLMPFNKNIIKEKELSIQIHIDGISFCTYSSQLFIDHGSSPIKIDRNFKKILEDNSLLDFERVNCIYFNQPATFVPSSLYESSRKENYVKQNVSLDPKLKINEYNTLNKEIQILHQVHSKEKELLMNLYKNIKFTHFTKVIYDYLSKLVNSDSGIVMYLHLQDSFFDVMVFDGQKLLFYNSYHYKHEEDFLYYTLAIAEELSLNPEEFSIIFLGKFNRYKAYYKALENYQEKLKYIDDGSGITFDQKEHPAPFFINIFD